MTPEEFVSRLQGVKKTAQGWEAKCPAHDDRHASLSVGVGQDGRVLVRCHAGGGCSFEQIVGALGLKPTDLFKDGTGSTTRRIVATYDYVDEAGTLLFQAVRFEPKAFAQRRPDGRGGWAWKLDDTRRVIFRLPQVLDAVKDNRTIYVVEGEKDVLALEAVGEVATCNAMGAGKWRKDFWNVFHGADVVVVQDRDDEGRKHASQVASSLEGIASSVRIVEAAAGKDAADHLAAGKSVAEFVGGTATDDPDTRTTQVLPHGVSSLSMPTASLEDVHRVLDECFPEVASETEICLSAAATLLLEDQQNPVALNMEGVPSSLKTTVVDFFGDAEDKCYRSDKFTPKSFVSHSASISREKLDEVDLLPRIRHKVFLVPELAPLFGLRNEDLLESFSILTRVLDGQGLQTDSGVHGRRGHTGDYLFVWIGCTTPIPHNVWKTMGKLGSRFLFIEMPAEEQSDAQLADGASSVTSYRDRVAACRDVVSRFLDTLWNENGGVRGVTWDRAGDPREIMLQIAAYAKVLARLRGTISIWREGSGEDETYNFSTPTIEGPQRAMSLLYALARGHALVHGRRQLTEEDLPVVARAALESTPNDRRAVMRLVLRDAAGIVETTDVQKALRCSAPTARAILETLEKLELGDLHNPGPPEPATFTLADELKWLLDPLKENRRREGARPLIGDDEYLPWLYGKLEAGVITDDEWHQGDKAHRLVVLARAAA